LSAITSAIIRSTICGVVCPLIPRPIRPGVKKAGRLDRQPSVIESPMKTMSVLRARGEQLAIVVGIAAEPRPILLEQALALLLPGLLRLGGAGSEGKKQGPGEEPTADDRHNGVSGIGRLPVTQRPGGGQPLRTKPASSRRTGRLGGDTALCANDRVLLRA
jgi:hypothetical protein